VHVNDTTVARRTVFPSVCCYHFCVFTRNNLSRGKLVFLDQYPIISGIQSIAFLFHAR